MNFSQDTIEFSQDTIETVTELFADLTANHKIFVKYIEEDNHFYYDLYYFITEIDETNFIENNYNISNANNFIKINFALNNITTTDQEVNTDMEFTYGDNTINLIDFLPMINPSYLPGGEETDVYNEYRNGNITFSDIEAMLEEISGNLFILNNLNNIRILMPFSRINDVSFVPAMNLLKKFICKYNSCNGNGNITRQQIISYADINNKDTGRMLPAGGKKTKTSKTKYKQYKRTRRSSFNHNLKKYTPSKIVAMFLEMLNTIKLYHWKTFSFAQHKATDELYSNLNSNIDKFVEIMLGKTGGRVNLTGHKTLPLLDYSNVSDFTEEVNKYKHFLIDMNKDSRLNVTNNADLLNVRDEILGNLNQFTYLLTFK